MTHSIIGLWQVEIDIDGRRTHVTHAYHPDGFMHLDAGEHGACFLWEATGDRTFRIRGSRPVEPAIHRFIGWQLADGEGEVGEDGDTFRGDESTHAPQPDEESVTRRARLTGCSASRSTPHLTRDKQ